MEASIRQQSTSILWGSLNSRSKICVQGNRPKVDRLHHPSQTSPGEDQVRCWVQHPNDALDLDSRQLPQQREDRHLGAARATGTWCYMLFIVFHSLMFVELYLRKKVLLDVTIRFVISCETSPSLDMIFATYLQFTTQQDVKLYTTMCFWAAMVQKDYTNKTRHTQTWCHRYAYSHVAVRG